MSTNDGLDERTSATPDVDPLEAVALAAALGAAVGAVVAAVEQAATSAPTATSDRPRAAARRRNARRDADPFIVSFRARWRALSRVIWLSSTGRALVACLPRSACTGAHAELPIGCAVARCSGSRPPP